MNTGSEKTFRAKVRRALRWDDLPSAVRRTIVGVIGGTVLLIGLAMTVLPGPAFIVIPIGLAILATEFAWARHYLKKARDLARKAKDKAGWKKKGDAPDSASVTARG
jgi:tellurite resistance protein TerC